MYTVSRYCSVQCRVYVVHHDDQLRSIFAVCLLSSHKESFDVKFTRFLKKTTNEVKNYGSIQLTWQTFQVCGGESTSSMISLNSLQVHLYNIMY